jgi:hypothetical protein
MLLETHLRRQCLLKTCLPPHTYILFNKYAGGRLVQRFLKEVSVVDTTPVLVSDKAAPLA